MAKLYVCFFLAFTPDALATCDGSDDQCAISGDMMIQTTKNRIPELLVLHQHSSDSPFDGFVVPQAGQFFTQQEFRNLCDAHVSDMECSVADRVAVARMNPDRLKRSVKMVQLHDAVYLPRVEKFLREHFQGVDTSMLFKPHEKAGFHFPSDYKTLMMNMVERSKQGMRVPQRLDKTMGCKNKDNMPCTCGFPGCSYNFR